MRSCEDIGGNHRAINTHGAWRSVDQTEEKQNTYSTEKTQGHIQRTVLREKKGFSAAFLRKSFSSPEYSTAQVLKQHSRGMRTEDLKSLPYQIIPIAFPPNQCSQLHKNSPWSLRSKPSSGVPVSYIGSTEYDKIKANLEGQKWNLGSHYIPIKVSGTSLWLNPDYQALYLGMFAMEWKSAVPLVSLI